MRTGMTGTVLEGPSNIALQFWAKRKFSEDFTATQKRLSVQRRESWNLKRKLNKALSHIPGFGESQ
jgi:hypothetical protein